MVISEYFLQWKHTGFSIHSFKMAVWDQRIKCSGMVKKSFPCWVRPYPPWRHHWQLRVHTEPKEVRSVHILSWGTSSGLIQLYLLLISHTIQPHKTVPLTSSHQPTAHLSILRSPCQRLAARIKWVSLLWRTKDRKWHVASAQHVN